MAVALFKAAVVTSESFPINVLLKPVILILPDLEPFAVFEYPLVLL